jgi:hypothetical protein
MNSRRYSADGIRGSAQRPDPRPFRRSLFGRCEVKSGIAPVNPLAAFFGSWTTALLIERPPTAYVTGTQPNPHSYTCPRYISWLNRVEIYFSIVQRKVLTPNDFSSLQELEQRLLAFQSHYERSASPFKWIFTRHDLHALLAKIAVKRLG